jgi:hypothetical protein
VSILVILPVASTGTRFPVEMKEWVISLFSLLRSKKAHTQGPYEPNFAEPLKKSNLLMPNVKLTNKKSTKKQFDYTFTMPSHLRSKNASVEGQQFLLEFDVQSDQSRRRIDEVERVGVDNCILTTSMASDYSMGQGQGSTSRGIMTTFVASREIELLTLEFNAFENVEESTVQVFYKEGSWSGVASDPGKWTKLADTSARIAPDERGAIIPTSKFTPVTIKPSVEYALYLHFDQSDVLRVNLPAGSIGEVAFSNGVLTSFMGVPLSDGPFPNTGFEKIAAFEGIFHYKEVEPCRETVTTSDIFLQFAINSDPEEAVMAELAVVVGSVMDALMTSDETLREYQDQYLLGIRATKSTFRGRSGECRFTIYSCSTLFHS